MYYNYILGVSRRDGEFRSDDRRDAWDLKGKATAKNSITRWRLSLEKKGWIIRTKESHQNPLTGKYSPIHYRVLSHEEWVEKHGETQCRDLKQYYATNGLPENSKSTANQQLENEHLSPKWGQDGDRHLSPKWVCAGPQNGSEPVPTVGTKRVLKKVCKESKEEKPESPLSPPSPAMPKGKIADVAIAVAIETNPAASISGKSKAEMVRIIEETNATADELIPIVRQIVEGMDDFQLKNAGSGISASLTGYIIIARKRSREVAAKAENGKKAAESSAAVEDWKKRFSTLQFGCNRGTEEWVMQAEDWVKANPPPAWLGEADDGLVRIDWRPEQVIKDEIKKARKYASDERTRTTHDPEDSFCACEQCQPDFWRDWKGGTEEFFDPRI